MSGARRPGRSPKYRSRYRWRENLQGYLFAGPWLTGFFLFLLGPMAFSVVLCMFKWNGITAFQGNATFVGLEHFRTITGEDRYFGVALYNTAYYAAISVPLGICTSLFLANLLNAKLRGIAFYRTVFYLPNVVAGVATIMIWRWLFNPQFGGFNIVLDKTGLVAAGRFVIDAVPGLRAFVTRNQISWPPLWFSDEFWAKPALIIMSLWSAGGGMLIYLAGLRS